MSAARAGRGAVAVAAAALSAGCFASRGDVLRLQTEVATARVEALNGRAAA